MFKIQGFTLVELLIVISIITILTTIGYVAYHGATFKARDSRRKADLNAVKKALSLASSDCSGGLYPVPTTTAAIQQYQFLSTGWLPGTPYMQNPPQDLQSPTVVSYIYSVEQNAVTGYVAGACPAGGPTYTSPIGGSPTYSLKAILENKNDPSGQESFNHCIGSKGVPGAYGVGTGNYYVCND